MSTYAGYIISSLAAIVTVLVIKTCGDQYAKAFPSDEVAGCISLSAVIVKAGDGEYCFDRNDKTYCLRRDK